MESRREYKIVTLGEGRVGKTSLTIKFVKEVFNEDEVSTINANFLQKDLMVENTPIKLNIWDTAGQERFKALAANYYRRASGAILVYDITDKSSMERVRHWVKELQGQVGQTIKIVIAGNKCDREQERNISKEEAITYAQSIGATHVFTSAKTGKGVSELYNEIARQVLIQDNAERQQGEQNKMRRGTRAKGISLQTLDDKPKKKNCC